MQGDTLLLIPRDPQEREGGEVLGSSLAFPSYKSSSPKFPRLRFQTKPISLVPTRTQKVLSESNGNVFIKF